MAKAKPTPPPVPTPPEAADDVKPFDASPAPDEGDDTKEIVKPFDAGSDDLAAELALLKAELAALKAEKAKSDETMGAGKFRVSLKDGPTAVVECRPGEHPFDVFKALCGVTGSIHAPEISRAKATDPVGVVR